MAKLIWDAVGTHWYEAGVSKGVLYPMSVDSNNKPTYGSGVTPILTNGLSVMVPRTSALVSVLVSRLGSPLVCAIGPNRATTLTLRSMMATRFIWFITALRLLLTGSMKPSMTLLMRSPSAGSIPATLWRSPALLPLPRS